MTGNGLTSTGQSGDLTSVSIIVNVFNGARYLTECLTSVLALEGPYALEVIIVDDASTDATSQIVASFSDPRIRFIRHEQNQGAAASINTAFEQVSGEFVARIDYDDRYRPDFLLKTVSALRAHSDAGLVCGAAQMIDGNGEACGIASPQQSGISSGGSDRFLLLLRNNFITAPTLLARAEVWRKALPVPSQLNFADWYMSLKMAQSSQIRVLDDVIADYRVHALGMHNTMVLDGTGEQMTERILNYFLSGTPLRKAVVNAIRAHHRALWADRYFYCRMNQEARRCYCSALLTSPSSVLCNSGRVRRMVGLLFGRSRYDAIKRLLTPYKSSID